MYFFLVGITFSDFLFMDSIVTFTLFGTVFYLTNKFNEHVCPSLKNKFEVFLTMMLLIADIVFLFCTISKRDCLY